MSRFKWGHSFISLNEGLLDRYAECDTAAEVVAAQNEFLESMREEGEHKLELQEEERNREGGGGYLNSKDLPPSSDDEDEYTDEDEEEEGEGEGSGKEHGSTVGVQSKLETLGL